MKQKSPRKTRLYILLTVFALVTAIAAPVIAQFIKNSGNVVNKLSPADSVNPTIVETFDDKAVKKDVYFKVGETDYPVYVRAAIVFTWQQKDGTVYFSQPTKGIDYTLYLNSTDWEKGSDGFYYFKKPVKSGGETSVLIESCEQIKEAPTDGYTLSVEIIAQTVQAIGTTDDPSEKEAWKDAWNLS